VHHNAQSTAARGTRKDPGARHFRRPPHHLTGSPGSASLWQGAFAGCPQFIQQVNSAGGDATMLFLPHAGQFGNSHMLMQDKNNLVVPI
jgi:hypothetical protein